MTGTAVTGGHCPDRRSLLRDPLLLALGAVTAVVVAFMFCHAVTTGQKAAPFWAVQALLDGTTAGITLSIALQAGLPGAVRRFYRAFAFSGFCLASGDLLQTVLAVRHPVAEATIGGPVQSALFVFGSACVLLVMLLYPTAVNTRRERLRFWLDAWTVLVGGSALAWALAAEPTVDRATALISAGLLLMSTFAAVKLLNSAAPPMARIAVVPCVIAVLIQGIALYVDNAVEGGVGLVLSLQIISSLTLVAGVRTQQVLVPPGSAWVTRTVVRSSNVLPYVATFAAIGTLAAVLPHDVGAKTRGVLIAVVLISVLVSVRQIDAFRENTQLIGRADASLDELGRKERWYRSLMQHSNDITFALNAEAKVIWVSPGVERVLGYTPQETIGYGLRHLVHHDDVGAARDAFALLIAEPGSTRTIVARYRHVTGDWRWLDGSCTNLLEEPGVESIICNTRDVTEARRFQDQLRHEATHDPLTGLPNRALFTTRLAAAARGRVALLLIDLDDFKLINDVHGHQAGDAVLAGVAQRLWACARQGDTPARLGGDEFAIVLADADADDAARMADHLRQLLVTPIVVERRPLVVGASIGVAAGVSVDPEDLLRAADQAMYAVKRPRAVT